MATKHVVAAQFLLTAAHRPAIVALKTQSLVFLRSAYEQCCNLHGHGLMIDPHTGAELATLLSARLRRFVLSRPSTAVCIRVQLT